MRATQAEAAASQPDTAVPVAEPAATEPVAADPVAAEQDAAAPVAEPVAAESIVTEPVDSEPPVTEPAAAAQITTEPVATGPAPVSQAAPEVEDQPAPLLPPDPTPTPSSVVIKPSTGDDLERIEGIGPKIAEVLRAAGLTTYAAMAAAHDHELEAILAKAGLRFAPTLSTWSVQAALLLQGDVAGADTLARGLMVGRETS